MKTQKILSYWLGTIMMVIPIIVLATVYFPYLRLYLFPEKIDESKISKEFSILIPKINATAPIIKNVDPFNESTYQEELKKGIAHANNTSLPGSGTTFLFAHSSDVPWRITKYNTAFFRIHELEVDDRIIIYYNKRRIEYKVTEKKTVKPTDTKFLATQNTNQLILQTCTPIGTSINRLLVFAKPLH